VNDDRAQGQATATSGSSNHSVLVGNLRSFFETQATYPLSFRVKQLKVLQRAIESNEKHLLDALYADLRKPPLEAYVSELGFVQADISHALRHLSRWARVQRRRTPPISWLGRSFIYPEPYGVVLIMGPWNYPFQLLFSPLVGAIAAGNCVCLKSSRFAPRTSEAIARMVSEAFPPDYVTVVKGARGVAESVLRERFDHVFFTGSTMVGRAVMEAASRHLTPVTLELGGKCPCIVCDDVNVETAARRIMWGKCLNAGQTCVAPDFVLAHRQVKDSLLAALEQTLHRFFGESVQSSKDFGRIVNRAHFDRLVGYLSQGSIVCGGQHDENDLFISPAIMTDVDLAAPVMQEEIFGPILPVLEFSEIEEALSMLRKRPKPLALYLFTNDRRTQEQVIKQTASGGVCINDTVAHILGKDLPFGGVGASGMGTYRGKAGFDCFTHYKSVLRRSLLVDPKFRYPPSSLSLAGVKRVCRFLLGG